MKRNRDPCMSETLSPLKRLKISTENGSSTNDNSNSPSKETRSKKGHHFFTACQQILTNEFNDIKTRLEFKSKLECKLVNNICTMHDKESLQVLPYEHEAFKIDVKSGMWNEALDVFKSVTKCNKFPAVDMFSDVIHMILCAVTEDQIFSDTYIIKKCQYVFKLALEIHPPCVEVVRTCYKDFLLSSFKNFENSEHFREILSSKENIFKSVLHMLFKEFNSVENSNNTIGVNRKPRKSSEETFKFSNSLEDFSVIEEFQKSDRIKRLFIVLELMVDLLEKDLHIWINKFCNNPLKHIVRPRKPLIVWLIWQSKILHYGMVNNFCRDVFKLVCDLIKFEYPLTHINIGIRLVNILFHTFYLCNGNIVSNYPEAGKKCDVFASELFTFIKSERLKFVLDFITLIKPKQLRCLLSVHLVKYLLKSPENDFMVLASSIFKACLWNRFKTDSKEFDIKCLVLPQHGSNLKSATDKSYLKFKTYLNKRSSFNSEASNDNTLLEVNEVTQLYFINACYLALYYYSDMYSIEKILLRHDDLCSNDCQKNTQDDNLQLLPLSSDCLRQYRVIVKTKTSICENLDAVKNECPFIYKLFKRIPFLQFV